MNQEDWYKLIEKGFSRHPGTDKPDERLFYLLKWIGGGHKILDIGCHDGKITNILAENNEVWGIDLPDVVKEHSKKYNFKYKPGNAEDIPFDDKSFDIVWSGNILAHCYSPYKVICEIERVLKSKGFLIAQELNGFIGKSAYISYFFKKGSFIPLIENVGFETINFVEDRFLIGKWQKEK